MSSHAHSADAWDSHAAKWSSTIQQITTSPCTALLKKTEALRPLDSPNSRVFDNGAGSGQLTGLIKARYPELPIVASDLSPKMLEAFEKVRGEQGWRNVETVVSDAQDLSPMLKEGSFSHVYSTFVINFTSDAAKAINEMKRVLRPGGVIGMANWSQVSWVACWESAVAGVEGEDSSSSYEAPTLFHKGTMNVDWTRRTLEEAGFGSIAVEEFKCFHPEKSVDDAVDEFYNMGNPSIKLLQKGFSEDFIEQSKPHFRAAYDRIYAGGTRRQYEVAILATGIRSL